MKPGTNVRHPVHSCQFILAESACQPRVHHLHPCGIYVDPVGYYWFFLGLAAPHDQAWPGAAAILQQDTILLQEHF